MLSDTTSLQNFKTSMFVSKAFSPAGSFPGFHVHTSGKNSETWAEQFRENKMAEKIVNSTKF